MVTYYCDRCRKGPFSYLEVEKDGNKVYCESCYKDMVENKKEIIE